MGILRRFDNLVPPPRAEADKPFTDALIDEVSDLTVNAEGHPEWLTIATIALEPLDTDSRSPAPRSLETESATERAAYYRVRWVREPDEEEAIGGVFYFDDDGVSMRPTVTEVAAYVRARTKVAGGKELGTFTETTRPTFDEVELLIGQALDHVSMSTGGEPCNERLTRSMRSVIALYAAILVEVSYFPESSSNQSSSAVRLEALFNSRLKILEAALAEECEGQGTGGDGPGGDSGAVAAGHFDDGRPLLGRDWPPCW